MYNVGSACVAYGYTIAEEEIADFKQFVLDEFNRAERNPMTHNKNVKTQAAEWLTSTRVAKYGMKLEPNQTYNYEFLVFANSQTDYVRLPCYIYYVRNLRPDLRPNWEVRGEARLFPAQQREKDNPNAYHKDEIFSVTEELWVPVAMQTK